MDTSAPKKAGLPSSLMEALITAVVVGATQKLGVRVQLAIAGVAAVVWFIVHRTRVPSARARRVTAWLVAFAAIVVAVAGWIVGIGVGVFALLAIAAVVILLLRRSKGGTSSSIAQSLGTTFAGVALGVSAPPIAGFVQDPMVTVSMDNRCAQALSVRAGPVEIAEVPTGATSYRLPAVVVRIERAGDHVRIRGLPLPIDATATRRLAISLDGKPIRMNRETRLDLRDRTQHRLRVTCG